MFRLDPRAFAAVVVLSALGVVPLVAQVPFDHVIVVENRTAAPETAFRFVDALPGGGVTELRDQRIFTPFQDVAVDPDDASKVFFTTDTSSLPGVWRMELEHETYARGVWGHWARVGAGAVAVGQVDVVYADRGAGGLAAVPKAGGAPRAVLPGVNVVDVAVDGQIAFALDDTTVVSRVDLAVGTVRTVGSYAAATCVGVRDSATLLVGTAAGEILTVDVASGGVRQRTVTGKGALVAVAQPVNGLPVFATLGEVWSLLDLIEPLYATPVPVLGFALGRQDRATVLRFGAGCGAAGRVPAHRVPSVPAIGDPTFAAAAAGGPPGQAATLWIGSSRSFAPALGVELPLDLGPVGLRGCALLVEPLVAAAAAFDGAGAVRIPLGIPSLPALRGTRLHAQWIGVDPGAPGGVAFSDGAAWQLR